MNQSLNTLSGQEPLVSVVVPVHNTENYLDELIECLIRQTYSNIEVLFVNDGSTDGSLAMLEQACATESRFAVLSQENGGAGRARNIGVSKSSGAYLICIDSDDLFEPDLIEKMVCGFSSDPEIDVVFCDQDEYHDVTGDFRAAPWAVDKRIIPSGVPFSPVKIPCFFSYVTGYPSNKMVKRELIEKYNLRWQEISMHEDMSFVQTVFAIARKTLFIDEELYHHRKRCEKTSLSDIGQDEYFDCIFMALDDIKANLARLGCLPAWEHAYANYALSQCRWKYYRVRDVTRPLVLASLRDKWLEKLGLSDRVGSEFVSASDYSFMCAVLERETPEEVEAAMVAQANCASDTHEGAKRSKHPGVGETAFRKVLRFFFG